MRALLYDQLRYEGEGAFEALRVQQLSGENVVRGAFERRRRDARLKERHGHPSHISAAIRDLEAAGWFPWSGPRV